MKQETYLSILWFENRRLHGMQWKQVITCWIILRYESRISNKKVGNFNKSMKFVTSATRRHFKKKWMQLPNSPQFSIFMSLLLNTLMCFFTIASTRKCTRIFHCIRLLSLILLSHVDQSLCMKFDKKNSLNLRNQFYQSVLVVILVNKTLSMIESYTGLVFI